MRIRLVLLVVATTTLVLVAFLIPLAVEVRSAAADRVLTEANAQLEALAPLVASVDRPTLRTAVDQANTTSRYPITVFLPDSEVMGAPAARSAAVAQAASGRSFAAPAPGGREVLVAVAGLPGGSAVLRTYVSDADMNRGVTHAWLVLGLLGVGLLAVSVLVADRLGRSLVRPLAAVVALSHQLAEGNVQARVVSGGGPREVREVGAGLNLLARRIGDLLAVEREAAADLSHRLRTPLTALRIDAESLRNPTERARIAADLDALERTVNDVIRAARGPSERGGTPSCDASEVVAERVAFWSALAEEEQRPVSVALTGLPVPVRVSADDLSACVDALLGNVFAHTPEGCGMAVRLTRLDGGGAELVVSDEGPGMPDDDLVLTRGASGAGSTGLGLDIVRRTARASGGAVTIGRAPQGGAVVTVILGPPQAPPRPTRASRRRTRRRPAHAASRSSPPTH